MDVVAAAELAIQTAERAVAVELASQTAEKAVDVVELIVVPPTEIAVLPFVVEATAV